MGLNFRDIDACALLDSRENFVKKGSFRIVQDMTNETSDFYAVWELSCGWLRSIGHFIFDISHFLK